MGISVDSRLITVANYIQAVFPASAINANQVTIGYYNATSGGGKAIAYLDAPGQIVATNPSALAMSRDTLYVFLTQTSQYRLVAQYMAMTKWDDFNVKLIAYQNMVRDYVAAGHVQWVGPFPQTIASAWRALLGAYVAAWSYATQVALQLIAAANNPNYTIPPVASSTATATPTAITSTTSTATKAATTTLTTLPPSTQAAILSGQTSVSPTGTATPAPTPASDAANAATTGVTSSVTTPGGQVQVPSVPQPPINALTVHTPMWKNPMFYVALGGVAVLGGVLFTMFKRRR